MRPLRVGLSCCASSLLRNLDPTGFHPCRLSLDRAIELQRSARRKAALGIGLARLLPLAHTELRET
ncbi:MAG: hypothetical protein LC098_04285 [Burkholderiales bacterium]|nr:hypothetical protein [Burkholderiales bacterium]